MTTTERVVSASPEDLPYLIAKIEKVNRKAVKNGLTPYTWTTSPVREEKAGKDARTGLDKYRQVVDLTVHGETPVIEGWEFVATLTWDSEAGLVTRVVPGCEDVDLSSLRVEGVNAWCDQCNTARLRHDTFAVRNVETGEIKQIGRNCLQAFIGLSVDLWIPSPDDFSGDDEHGGWFGRGEVRTPVLDFLADILAVAEHDGGYVSRGQARAANGGY